MVVRNVWNSEPPPAHDGPCTPTEPSVATDATSEAACGTSEASEDESVFCPHFHHAVELLGRRWTGVVLRAMLRGATRYSDIQGAVPSLSSKMLTERLKELEAEGVVERTVVPSTPVRVEYHLTEKGRALDAVINAVSDWSERWAQAPKDRPCQKHCVRHETESRKRMP